MRALVIFPVKSALAAESANAPERSVVFQVATSFIHISLALKAAANIPTATADISNSLPWLASAFVR